MIAPALCYGNYNYSVVVIILVEQSDKSPFWRLYFETGRNLFLPQTINELDDMFSHAFYRPLWLTSHIKYGILDIMKPKYPGFAEGIHAVARK